MQLPDLSSFESTVDIYMMLVSGGRRSESAFMRLTR